MTTKLERIVELLIDKNKPLTANQIAIKETLDIDKVRVYLNTLYKKGRAGLD